MTNEKVKGLILKLNSYKDADKLASIFTFEQGIITAKFTGVKRDKAKMKAVAQPFVFAEFVLNNANNKNTVISADIIDDFSNILSNYDKTICGYIILDILRSILPKEKSEQEIFLSTLANLKNLETKNEYIATIKFILDFINLCGMKLNLNSSFPFVYLDKEEGNFTVEKTLNCTQIDKHLYLILCKINDVELENIENITATSTQLKQILRMLHNIIFIKFDTEIKSFEFLT